MTNIEKYNKAFIEAFDVSGNDLKELKYMSRKEWDSIGHMLLISILEETFDIMMDTDDIIDFSSYEKGKEILIKYNVML